MKKILWLIIVFGAFFPGFLPAQFLSNLNARNNDPVFTSYAASLSRSDYKTDQGYALLWNDPESGVEFSSKDGLNIGVAFRNGKKIISSLGQFYHEPVITASYSDLVKFHFEPFKDILVEITFIVHSSLVSIEEVKVENLGTFPVNLDLLPYCYYYSGDSSVDIRHENPFDLYSFPLRKNRDDWMKEHNIPLTENLTGFVTGNLLTDSVKTFVLDPANYSSQEWSLSGLTDQWVKKARKSKKILKGILQASSFRIYPGEKTSYRIIYGVEPKEVRPADFYRQTKPLLSIGLEKYMKEDEKLFASIPDLQKIFSDKGPYSKLATEHSLTPGELKLFYYECFSLMRQCMMPHESECHQNYYLFSREPKWGWGYGGQVFHESLTMLAYALMDPKGAMNSQRIYFERQHPNGYINYRTGPYLNETIEYNHQLTSSAPWFNYQNLEIFKITKDKVFLQDAYQSGLRFYEYFVASRDSNQNGLCEWGAEASLESVRDARVAVWDQVGWPSNFEGPDINSMLVVEANSLAEMAALLGKNEEAVKFRKDAKKRKELINRFMWDEQSGFYYNVNKKDQAFSFQKSGDLKIKEIIGFLPLWAGVSDSSRAKTLVDEMFNPATFGRPFGIPTLAANESYYNPIGYWNGPVWVQWDYLLFRGLIDNGYKNEAAELAFKVIDNMIHQLKTDHFFWEFYSADDRQAGWNHNYIWAGIAARFLYDLEQLNDKQ
ncbi:MAG: trehalase family glycosidase [Bacteroidota bacterium]